MSTTTTTPSLSGLARILSNEPLPFTPYFRSQENLGPEIEQYVRNLHIYLKNLFGKFTASNIITTIGGGGGSGVIFEIQQAIHYVGTDTITFSVDGTRDWRDYSFLNYSKMATTRDGLRGVTTSDKDYGEYSGETSDLVVLDDGSLRVTINVDGTTGEITCTMTNGGGVHVDRYVLVNLEAYGKIPADAGFRSKGNGL